MAPEYLLPGNSYQGQGVFHSRRPRIPLPDDPFMDIISYLNLTVPGDSSLALVDSFSGEKITYRELKQHYRAVGAGLSELGIKAGDVVLILSPNSIWFPVAFLGILSIGAITTTVNPVYTRQEVCRQIYDCHPRLIITVPTLYSKVEDVGIPVAIIGEGGDSSTIAFSDLLSSDASKAPKVTVKQTDTAALLYSSGTTGLSKGVILSHRNLLSVSLMLHLDAPPEDRRRSYLVVLPMFHVYGLSVVVMSQILRGAELVVMHKFELSFFLETLQKYRVTDVPVVPPMILLLAKSDILDNYDLSEVVEITSGAAPLGADIMQALAARLPHIRIRQGFGMTETSGLATVAIAKEDKSHYGSVGPLVSDVEGKVIDVSTGKCLPPNEVGEICLRGPNIMEGYLNNPEATSAMLDKQGWLSTGDLGYFDNEGNMYIVDRIKELIKFKGFQVAPAELEGLLLTHPEILDAAVVPLPDDDAGEVPVAYVVRSPSSKVTEQDIIDFIGKQVAFFKKLRRVTFISSIPKSGSGKILRRELVAQAKSKL